jgi:hypothetical protein
MLIGIGRINRVNSGGEEREFLGRGSFPEQWHVSQFSIAVTKYLR